MHLNASNSSLNAGEVCIHPTKSVAKILYKITIVSGPKKTGNVGKTIFEVSTEELKVATVMEDLLSPSDCSKSLQPQ